ncbi:ATP-binding cassette domain-containing protein [Rhizobiales bacterium RZME27]|uniref:ATP-binding cassette domain-containing protein n=1 Tax=Endobacterium cereale TaxID=2663029 RepID=A0A6A8AHB0_9HYPH|nr:ABC transporter ATP-binding protein [Endobacterium cereale]MEB2847320.1 ABC transporter ATP-binding protein [Endobacterium cereale]MQY49170.1 ATP-binding cassette domain-containing protein [Endobacterium cereale]
MDILSGPDIAAVAAERIELAYGATRILKGIDFTLPKGETLALLGPSGCGKTTLLRLVAGLLTPTAGSISIAGTTVADAGRGLYTPPEKRGLGMVFQDYALWPHMTVGSNVAFPLEMRGVSRADRERRVRAALSRVGLDGFAERSPADMSGGQQQRVAIARAIVAEPQIVLFDEPLSNLDRELRESMVNEIGNLVSTLGLTALYVTHDQSEAFSLAHKVAVMRGGLIEQMATPEEVILKPASAEVADFLRLGSVTPVERHEDGYRIPGTSIRFSSENANRETARQVLIPARSLRVTAAGAGNFDADVMTTRFRGDGHLTTVRIASSVGIPDLTFLSSVRLTPGQRAGITVDAGQLCWFN